MRRRVLLKSILLSALVVLLISGVVSGCGSGRTAKGPSATPAEMVKKAGPMPTWLASGTADLTEIYAWAAAHQAELQYIPCYCGCGSMGHTNNAQCYFTTDKTGQITAYDQHAFT